VSTDRLHPLPSLRVLTAELRALHEAWSHPDGRRCEVSTWHEILAAARSLPTWVWYVAGVAHGVVLATYGVELAAWLVRAWVRWRYGVK
jgi:hypothetical protein